MEFQFSAFTADSIFESNLGIASIAQRIVLSLGGSPPLRKEFNYSSVAHLASHTPRTYASYSLRTKANAEPFSLSRSKITTA